MPPSHLAASRKLAPAWRPLALLVALSLAACSQESTPPPPTIPRASPEQLAERLPQDAAEFRRGVTAPITEPFPGREVAYATPSRTAAAFVQLLSPGGEPLADGPSSPAVQAEYARWRDDTARGVGPHRRLRIVSEGVRSGLFQCAELEGSYGRQPVQSMICVGAAAGQMLRIRLSMPRRDPPAADTTAFLDAIHGALR